MLAGFTADVEFDVADDVGALKSVMGTNDPASYLTEANSITVDNDGLGDRVVNASDGAILAGFTADVSFDVVDDANAVAAEVTGIGNTLDDLDEAADVVVSGGDVSTAEAAAIQQISEYNESGSAYEITDNAAAVISAGDSVIEDGGVTRVEVTGDASAAQGVDLNAYNANVDFNVRGTLLTNYSGY